MTMETCLVEILADGRPVPPGAEGEIFVTDLTNYGFPLIRYAIEDHGGWMAGSCSCGRSLGMMSHGVGRLSDQYVAPDGSRHSILALSTQIGETGPPLGPVQFIQKSLMHFHLLVTNDPPVTDEIERHIRRVMHRLISSEIEITMEAVPDLPREKSGKLRYCICEVDQPVEALPWTEQ